MHFVHSNVFIYLFIFKKEKRICLFLMLILLPGDSRWHCCYTFSHGYVESTVWQDVVTAIEMVLAGNYGSALLIKQCVHETNVPR